MENQEMLSETPRWSKEATRAIIQDLSVRYGLGDEWAQVDDNMQMLIRGTWARIIAEYAPKCGGPPEAEQTAPARKLAAVPDAEGAD